MRDLTQNPLRFREVVVRMNFLDSRPLIHSAVEAWAKDAGWVPAREAEGGLVYVGDATGRLALSSGVFRSYRVAVSFYDYEDGVGARFAVGVAGQLPGIESDLERAGETFAEGVSSYLEQLRATAGDEGAPGQLTRRSRRGSITRFLKLSQNVLVIALVPVTALTYLISGSGIAAMFAWLWVGMLLLLAMLIRYRVYGMHMWLLTPAVAIGLLGAIGGTLAIALVPPPV